jgi:catechol 2,3-dioxygenase-like lactoylglutathione lyase family enzyme
MEPAKISNIHHSAYRCRDAEQTRWFYEDVLGLKLKAALVLDEISGTDIPREYMHLFFEMPDGNFIAFFDEPNNATPESFKHKDGLDLHVAFEIDNRDDLDLWKKKIRDARIKCHGPIDHGFVHSIYMYDPNGIQVEITCADKKYDEILAAKEAVVREQFKDWTARTREQKEKVFGSQELDRREVSKWLDD